MVGGTGTRQGVTYESQSSPGFGGEEQGQVGPHPLLTKIHPRETGLKNHSQPTVQPGPGGTVDVVEQSQVVVVVGPPLVVVAPPLQPLQSGGLLSFVLQAVNAQSPSSVPQNVGCTHSHVGAAVVVVVVVGAGVVLVVVWPLLVVVGAAVVLVVVGAAVVVGQMHAVVVVVKPGAIVVVVKPLLVVVGANNSHSSVSSTHAHVAADQIHLHSPSQLARGAPPGSTVVGVGAGVVVGVAMVVAGCSTNHRPPLDFWIRQYCESSTAAVYIL